MDTIKAWALIVRLTVAEYLGLDPTESNRPKEVRASEEVEDGERIGMGKRNGDELVSSALFRIQPCLLSLTAVYVMRDSSSRRR